ncbi:MAG TPA: hypothetical protein VF396_25580, partial [Bradyrhizobium sp.]
MKLQGSDTQSIKTLQSENAPQPKLGFPISGLDLLHGRLITVCEGVYHIALIDRPRRMGPGVRRDD